MLCVKDGVQAQGRKGRGEVLMSGVASMQLILGVQDGVVHLKKRGEERRACFVLKMG